VVLYFQGPHGSEVAIFNTVWPGHDRPVLRPPKNQQLGLWPQGWATACPHPTFSLLEPGSSGPQGLTVSKNNRIPVRDKPGNVAQPADPPQPPGPWSSDPRLL